MLQFSFQRPDAPKQTGARRKDLTAAIISSKRSGLNNQGRNRAQASAISQTVAGTPNDRVEASKSSGMGKADDHRVEVSNSHEGNGNFSSLLLVYFSSFLKCLMTIHRNIAFPISATIGCTTGRLGRRGKLAKTVWFK